MSGRILRTCSGGCGRIIPGSQPRCPECAHRHATRDAAQRTARARRDGRNTAQWQRIRRHVLSRDEYQCVRCGAPATHVHRVGQGWHSAHAEYESLCASCHGRHHAHEQQQRAAHIRAGKGAGA